MKKGKRLFYLLFLFSFLVFSNSVLSQKKNTVTKPLGAVTASFTAPDTVCVNTPVQINNTSVGASNYYWSFCEANFSTAPAATNLGNPGNLLSLPVFLDIAQDASGNYFAFVVNNTPGGLVRMNFGNSLLNTPTVDFMGNFGGVIPPNAEGIQVVNVNGNWVIVIQGGDPAAGNASAIIKIDLGTSLASTTGVATNWGNIGSLSYPHDLYIFTVNNIWYGYAVNARDNTITQFNFGTDFSTTPTGINLGDIGNLNIPTGIGAINSGGTWHLFITNDGDNTITRLDFGNSLLNTPTGINIGNPGNSIDNPRDISFIQLCNNTEAYVVNATSNTISQLDFGNNLLSTPTATNLGNLGNMSFPHSISKLFRVNSDVYALVPNVNNNSLTQLHFSGCSTPGSTLQNPTNVTYNTHGIYNINLLVDLGLPTQTSFCKQIVVKDCPLQTCNNWLYTPSQPSAVEVGQLNITGHTITIEAEINRTTPYVGGTLYAGDIVSKHSGPIDANYLLRPNEAEITTTNGYFRTPDICEIELNKTYHVAMTYDGATLKFYRNGFLMSQIAATGDLFQNTWATRIGFYVAALYNENFIGYTNEVRIWNVVRTQAQLQAYMNTPLPSPATQTGLLAYYQFNDLLNKQGNPAWNGTLIGSASINQTNPKCVFVADSCCPILQGTITGENLCKGSNATLTFNTTTGTPPYILTYSDGTNTYTQNNVRNNVPFILANQPTANTSYMLLTIQDSSSCPPTTITGVTATININTCSLCKGSLGDPVVNITFGSGNNPGQPLPSIVPGASTTLTYVAVTGNPATPTPLDGQYTITNNVPANASWFAGALDHTPNNPNGYMAFYNASEQPGEFYSDTVNNLCGSTTYEFAAWIANALNPAITAGVNPNITFTIEQTDGTILGTYNTGDILQTNTFTWKQYGFFFTTPSNISSVVLKMINNNPGGTANVGNDLAIDDITFRPCGPVTTASFSATAVSDTIIVCAGAKATVYGTVSTGYNAPNYLWQLSIDSGKTWTDIPNSNNLQLPVNPAAANVTKVYTYRLMTAEGNNINSPNCRVASNVVALIINPLPQAQLTGGDICGGDGATLFFSSTGGVSPFSIQYNNGTNTYTLAGLSADTAFAVPYPLTDTTTFTLVTVTDANGCVDTANTATVINVNPLPQGGIAGSTICAGDSASVTFTASSGNAPFAIVIYDGTNASTYYGIVSGAPFKIAPLNNTETISLISITGEDGNGCARTDGFTSPDALITVNPSPQIQFDSLANVCALTPPFLITQAKEISGIAGSGVFSGDGVDASGNFSPLFAGWGQHTITYTFSASDGCDTSKSQNIIVYRTPAVSAGPDLIDCKGTPIQLKATGGVLYVWSPSIGLSSDSVANPYATPDDSVTYTVTATDINGCTNSDEVKVNVLVSVDPKKIPNAFSPNNDGINDTWNIEELANIQDCRVQVFNRWGQVVFSSTGYYKAWDGKYNGQPLPYATYYYIIEVNGGCHQKFSGPVTIIY